MAQYDKETKFYWLQLKEDFFDNDAIEWLEEQKPNGRDYAYFYLKLCLKSLKSNGILIRKVGNILIPYDNKKLAELTKMDFDTVTVAMELLKKIGLIEILENGEIYIKQLEQLIGSKSLGALRKQQQRIISGQKVDNCPPKIGQGNENCPPKIESELKIESKLKIESEQELKDGLIDINNYLNNIDFVQNINSDYNEVFKNLRIYFDDTCLLPPSVANQIKLYQIAVKQLYDNKQFELLNKVNLPLLEKVFGNVIKQQNITNIKEYYITSLINELIKIYKEDKKDDKT